MTSNNFDSCLLELENYYSKLKLNKSESDKCLLLIERMKDLTSKDNKSYEFFDKDHLLKFRSFLELSALIAQELNDSNTFKCVYTQLHPLYFDFNNVLGRSPRINLVLSNWMLHLLSENKIGDLYMLFELIPDDLKKDEKVSFVIELERLMMEGNFSKLLDLSDENNEYFKIISSTARNKMASSIELSYKQMTMDNLSKILKLKLRHELLDFISYYNQYKLQLDPKSVPWKIVDDVVLFQNDSSSKQKIPSKELLSNALEYLNDLEKIV